MSQWIYNNNLLIYVIPGVFTFLLPSNISFVCVSNICWQIITDFPLVAHMYTEHCKDQNCFSKQAQMCLSKCRSPVVIWSLWVWVRVWLKSTVNVAHSEYYIMLNYHGAGRQRFILTNISENTCFGIQPNYTNFDNCDVM